MSEVQAGSSVKPRHCWVVETYLRHQRRWYAMDARVSRASAWALMREDRKKYPQHKFRCTKYVSTKP